MSVSVCLLTGALLCAVRLPAGSISVAYDGYVICRVRTNAWGLSAYARAVSVTRRFTAALNVALQRQVAHPELRQHVRVARIHGQWVVCYGQAVLITATTADARCNNTTPYLLARLWATRFQKAIDMAVGWGNQPRQGSAIWRLCIILPST